MVNACNPEPSHPWIHSELEASLGYVRFCLNKWNFLYLGTVLYVTLSLSALWIAHTIAQRRDLALYKTALWAQHSSIHTAQQDFRTDTSSWFNSKDAISMWLKCFLFYPKSVMWISFASQPFYKHILVLVHFWLVPFCYWSRYSLQRACIQFIKRKKK